MFSFFSGTHIPKSIDTSVIPAAPGEGCPRCGGEVFHAEKMLSKKSVYHKARVFMRTKGK